MKNFKLSEEPYYYPFCDCCVVPTQFARLRRNGDPSVKVYEYLKTNEAITLCKTCVEILDKEIENPFFFIKRMKQLEEKIQTLETKTYHLTEYN